MGARAIIIPKTNLQTAVVVPSVVSMATTATM